MSKTVRNKVVAKVVGKATKELIHELYLKNKKSESDNYYDEYFTNDEYDLIDFLEALDDVVYERTYRKSDNGYYGGGSYKSYNIVGSWLIESDIKAYGIPDGSTTVYDKEKDEYHIDAVYYNGGTHISEIIRNELIDKVDKD